MLVIQPVKKITIDAGRQEVAAGSTLAAERICSPDNASIKDVTWTSKNPHRDGGRNGLVTGLKKGSATITATAADGSRPPDRVLITVTQPVTSITLRRTIPRWWPDGLPRRRSSPAGRGQRQDGDLVFLR